MQRLETLILDREMVAKQKDLRIVFTPIHGTGGVIIKPMLQRLGFQCVTPPEQDGFDGRFPTVKSPNPENAEALAMAIDLANRQNADLVMATDPDCDRMGVAARPDGLLPGQKTDRTGSDHAGERVTRRDHQDIRHHRFAENHRGEIGTSLRGNAHRFQIHRRKTWQI
jgi:phosphomannomutase